MTDIERPDLSAVEPAVIAYIEALERELLRLGAASVGGEKAADTDEPDPGEPATTINVITVSAAGAAKRSPRHLYGRQRRGGMGVFGLDSPADDRPLLLAMADEGERLILISNFGRAFRLPVEAVVAAPVHGRGQSLPGLLPYRLQSGERLVVALAAPAAGYIALLSERGWVRRIHASYFGEKMLAGATFHDIKEGGPLVAGCQTPGDADLFIISRLGSAIRFDERLVPVRGCQGLRILPQDGAVAVTAASQTDGVFILAADGKGTIRLMSGFAANKAPAAGGKVAIKSDRVVGAVTVGSTDDLFVISGLGKVIRFRADEVPAKEGVVQGVNCIALRADEAVAVIAARVAATGAS
jgi:DNA gyrase subunit A